METEVVRKGGKMRKGGVKRGRKGREEGKEEKSKYEGFFVSNTNLKTSLRLFTYFEYDKMFIL